MVEKKKSVESTVKNIRRKTKKQYSAEEKIQILIEMLFRETTVAELHRKKGISLSSYYSRSKEHLEEIFREKI